MPQPTTALDALLGLLAVRTNFLTPEVLNAAFEETAKGGGCSLEQFLVTRGLLQAKEAAALRVLAEGQLARDEANLNNARVDLDRYQKLMAQNAIPEQQLATQKATVAQDEGIVKSDQGQIDSAKLGFHAIKHEFDRTAVNQVHWERDRDSAFLTDQRH